VRNKCVGPPYSQTRIYAARMSYAADDAHRPPLRGFAAAASATPGTHGRTIIIRLSRNKRDDLRSRARKKTNSYAILGRLL